MKKLILLKSIFIGCILVFIASCAEKKEQLNLPETDLAKEPLIPMPLKIIPTNSAFALDQFTAIYTSPRNEVLNDAGTFLSEKITAKTGLRLPVNNIEGATIDRIIYINQVDSLELENKESYQLYIKKDSIILNAKTTEGAFRGIQTLRQLIPKKSNDTIAKNPMWLIPTGKIIDAPNFEYRGVMLDVARHFFSVEDVKKYIDVLAYYKYNAFHMHLSDDQGWRIEIKSWPKLTTIGSKTEVGGSKGGFYTQEEFKELVAYAGERYIQIIPEIDMPGHTNAASLSYPFLHAGGKADKPRVRTDMKVGYSSFNTRKDTVYAFIDDVVREISAISPSPYFHIGGDESHVTKKKDYIYFVERVEKIVNKYNKQMIGWDEVAQARVGSSSVTQFWNSKENAATAVEKGMQVLLSPAKKAYLDMKYDPLSKHGLNWAAYIPVDSAYVWTPETYSGIPKENILGIEAPLWSETISTISELEYLAFPRAIGYSELGWSTKENRNWEDYKERLAKQASFLERMNVNYYPSNLIDWEKNEHSVKKIEKD